MMTERTVCRLCKYPAEPDDVALGLAAGRYICLRCYTRELGLTRSVPRRLRLEIEDALAAGDRSRM